MKSDIPFLKLSSSPYPRDNYKLFSKYRLLYISKIPLPEPLVREVSYAKVISDRQSRRTYGGPLKLSELSTILWDVFKIKKIEVDTKGNIVWAHRGALSAGGLYSVETLITNISGYEDRLFYYNPYDHSLEELKITSNALLKLTSTADEIINGKNATLFIFIADPKNLYLKYKNAESLLWRDTGVIYALINLTAESLGLHACGLGTTFHPLIAKILQLENKIFGVGGYLIGYSD